jgi:carboxypeptidase PM20D1
MNGRTLLRRGLLGLAAVVAVLVLVVGARTALTSSRQITVQPIQAATVEAAQAAACLAAAVRFRTIASDSDPALNREQFEQFHAFLARTFPRVHAQLKREVVGGLSLLYTWPGRDPQAAPIALMAHQDVVPIAPGTEGRWQVPPFAGEVRDGYIWGRGAWDNKGNLMSQLEAVEMLLGSGFQPRQTVYLIAGADEEVGGRRGAQAVAALLKSRGVVLDFVLDEGLLVTHGIMPGLQPPAALIGVAEKGYATYQLSVDTAPGHSSMPPARSAIGMLGAALARLEDRQMPAAIRGVALDMFDTLAPEMSGINRVLLSNLWLFRPLVQAQLEKSPSSNAMLRTTTAPTIIQAGNKENVLPGHAEAVVNFRVLPGDSLDDVHQHVRQVVANDAIQLQPRAGSNEATPVSPSDSPAYQLLGRTVREVFPGTVVAPGLMIAATDSRHFTELSRRIYRFSPVRARPEDLSRFHGTDERISVSNYVEAIQFYHQLLRNAAQLDSPHT